MRKISKAKHPKYDITDSVLQRDVKDLDKYEVDLNLTNVGVQNIIENLQIGMRRRFNSTMPSAEWRHYSFGDGNTYLLLQNQQLNMTMCDDGKMLKFSVNIRTSSPNKQTYKFLQKWWENMAQVILCNRKPIYTDFGAVNTTEELKKILEKAKLSCIAKDDTNK